MRRIKLKTINKEVVKPFKKKEVDVRPVRGGDIIPMDTNVYEVAPTAGGKTTTTFHILKKIVTSETKIVAFVSTIFNDDTWIAIREWAADKEIEFEAHMSIFENGRNLLKGYVEQFQEEAIEREKKRAQKKIQNLMPKKKQIGGYRFDEPVKEEEEEKPRRSKWQQRKYIFVFDDIADETRSVEYTTLLKSARHYTVTTITSGQDLKQIDRPARLQVRIWLLFRSLNAERLKDVYDSIGSAMTFEEFVEVYKYATAEPYNFLYIAPRVPEYRKNFNKQIPI
jgi:hypothetical protein